MEKRIKISCPGKTYAGGTREVVQERNEDYWGSATAVCDVCKTRVPLRNMVRLPIHYLDVTIHDVHVMSEHG
jgi:hypothetical protein